MNAVYLKAVIVQSKNQEMRIIQRSIKKYEDKLAVYLVCFIKVITIYALHVALILLICEVSVHLMERYTFVT